MCVVRHQKLKRQTNTSNSNSDNPLEAAGNVNSPSTSNSSQTIQSIHIPSSLSLSVDQDSSTHRDQKPITIFKSYVFENRVHVWILPLSYSQSNYGGRRKPSSACTLITVQLAYDFLSCKLAITAIKTSQKQNLPAHILEVMVNAIVDGNDTHEKAMVARKKGHVGTLKKKDLENIDAIEEPNIFSNLLKRRVHRDLFTVPEAIKVHRPEMHEMDFKSYTGNFISNLISAINMAVTSPLLMSLDRLPLGVLAFQRAMCFIFDRPSNTIIVIDTHMHFHGKAGSIIASASYSNISDFVINVSKCVFPEAFKSADLIGQFEITCLMHSGITSKVYRGKIFQTLNVCPKIKNTGMKLTKTKPVVVKEGSDSGYESADGAD